MSQGGTDVVVLHNAGELRVQIRPEKKYMKTGIQIDSYSISDPKGTDIKRFKCQEIALSA